jgi:hypothetical protein
MKLWIIGIHSDSCPFCCDDESPKTCQLSSSPKDECNLNNCPKKLRIGDKLVEEEGFL